MIQQFRVKTIIRFFDSARDFCREFQIGKYDLILTRRDTYERYLAGDTGEAVIVDFRKYGSGEPTDRMVEAIQNDIKDISFNRVIAIGGGSVLDVGKLLALSNKEPMQELFERKVPLLKDKEYIAIPTTCGTGSEVTNISVLELSGKNTKLGLAAEELFADYAILIPELLNTLPYKSFALSSIDAFVHALESYLSPKANEITRMFSVKAMSLILRGYQRIATEGEQVRPELIKDFLQASTFAGIAFSNAGVGAVHALSYPLSSAFHLAHGEANYAVLWGVLWIYNILQPLGAIRDLNRLLAEQIGCIEERLYQELKLLLDRILPGKTLKEYGADKEILENFTTSVLANQGRLLANTYVELNQAYILAIYTFLYE